MKNLEIHIRCVDLEPVQKVLAAASDLANAVESYTDGTIAFCELDLNQALREFKATVRAQVIDGC